MRLLAIDTCLGACSAAVAIAGRVCASAYEERRTGHAEAIMPMIAQVLAEAGLAPDELERIAVTRGPGTFAGMRIGLAAAEGLSLATRAALVPVSSLWAIGQRLLAEHGPVAASIAVVLDAGRGQVYLELLDRLGRPREGPCLVSIEQAREQIGGAAGVVVGSGAVLSGAEPSVAVLMSAQPSAARFVLAAAELPLAEQAVAPLYFRPADAVVQSSPQGLR